MPHFMPSTSDYRAANGSAGGEVGSHPGSHNNCYVMRANSSALTLRLVWQSSLATLPFCRRSGLGPVLTVATNSGPGCKKWQSLVSSLPIVKGCKFKPATPGAGCPPK